MTEATRTDRQAKVGAYFERAAFVWDTFYDGKRSLLMRWVDRRFRSDVFVRFQMTFEELGNCRGKTVLDIGCGSGPYSVFAAKRGCVEVVGLDMAESMIHLAQKRAEHQGVADRCRFIVGPYPQASPQQVFDHAIVMGVMDYVDHPVSFVQAVRNNVRRSAAFSFPSIHWLRSRLRKYRYGFIKRCPVFFYRREEVDHILREGGFEEVEITKIPGAGMDYFAVGRTTK